MRLFPFARHLVLSSLMTCFLNCGVDPSRSSSISGFNGLAEEAVPTTGTGVDGVTMTKGDCDSSATPSTIPAPLAPLNKLTVTFCVKINVRDSFTYDAKKWGFVFGGLTTDPYVGKDEVEVVTDDSSLTGTATERKGRVSLAIVFKDGQVPTNITDQIKDENGRKTLKIFPYYAALEKGPQESSSVGFNTIPAISLQSDLGAIKAPPNIGRVSTFDGSFVVEFAPPSSLVSEVGDPVSKALSDVAGTSTLLGYLLMYWNFDECKANAEGWQFDVNPNYDATRSSATDYSVTKRIDTCVPPQQLISDSKEICDFGCDLNPDPNFFGRPAQNVLQPKVIPKVSGKAGKLVSGCYNVVRVDASAKSFAIDGLDNGEVYGVTLFALDGSGRVGFGRSACRKVVPTPVPLASVEKGATTKDSDCFVVTAASGSTGSQAVHNWRVVRDGYLEPTSVGKWLISRYYQYGPAWAHNLESKPSWFKSALHGLFDVSAKVVLKGIHLYQNSVQVISEFTHKWIELVMSPFASSSAFAQETEPVKGVGPSEGRQSSALSASSHMYFLGGVSFPTEDKDLYKGYYSARRPYLFVAGQTFRLFDVLGEIGAGAEFSYLSGRGKVPSETVRTNVKLPEESVGKNIGYYALGIRLVADYSLRIDAFPYIRPRFVGFLGAQKFREQPDDPNKSEGGEKKEGENRIAVKGAEGWSTVMGLRAGLQASILALFGDDAGAVMYSYGVQDLVFHAQLGLSKDLSKKTLSTSGTQVMGGLAFLFL